MGDVVYGIGEKRQKKYPPKPRLDAKFFCTRCAAENFKLSATGTVHCATCGSLMRNLLVTMTPPSAA